MDELKKLQIVITGGSGLIGTHLTKELLKEKKYQITIVDKVAPSIKGVKFIKSNFSDAKIMLPILKKAHYLFHLAAMVGVDNCRLNPQEVIKVNYTDTRKLIDWCIKYKLKKIIFASSSEVYGNSRKIPFKEDNKLFPISEYAKCKLKIEKYLKKVQEKSSIKVSIVRFFNVYGPGQKDMVIPLFVSAASKNEQITVLGDGNQTRCFTYITDAVKGIIKVLRYNRAAYEIFNIGSNTEIKIKDLAKIILKQIPSSKSKITHIPYGGKFRNKSLEVNRRIPSIKKAQHLLNFEAETNIEIGINNYLNNL